VVVRTLAFLILRQLLGVVGVGSTSDAKDVEIAVQVVGYAEASAQCRCKRGALAA
jgi:hypothetical protein